MGVFFTNHSPFSHFITIFSSCMWTPFVSATSLCIFYAVDVFMTHFMHSFPLQTPSVVGVCWTCSLALLSSTSRFVPTARIYPFHSCSPCSIISIHHLHLSCLVSALLSTTSQGSQRQLNFNCRGFCLWCETSQI